MADFRVEMDTMGAVKVPLNAKWGPQTQRSVDNFQIGPSGSMPKEIIRAFGYLKKAAALTNAENSNASFKSTVANAHAVLARSCGLKSPMP